MKRATSRPLTQAEEARARRQAAAERAARAQARQPLTVAVVPYDQPVPRGRKPQYQVVVPDIQSALGLDGPLDIRLMPGEHYVSAPIDLRRRKQPVTLHGIGASLCNMNMGTVVLLGHGATVRDVHIRIPPSEPAVVFEGGGTVSNAALDGDGAGVAFLIDGIDPVSRIARPDVKITDVTVSGASAIRAIGGFGSVASLECADAESPAVMVQGHARLFVNSISIQGPGFGSGLLVAEQGEVRLTGYSFCDWHTAAQVLEASGATLEFYAERTVERCQYGVREATFSGEAPQEGSSRITTDAQSIGILG